MEFINELARNTPITKKADVVVVGGGPAGCGAAIRAARNGADTFVIERFGSFGGTGTNGFMFIAITHNGADVRGLSQEIFDKLKPGGYCVNLLEKYPDLFYRPIAHFQASMGVADNDLIAFDPDMTSITINELAETAGVKFLLRSLFVDTIVENGAIKAVIVENASGRQAIEGKVYIDATGRGDVVARSGAPFVSGRDEMGFPMPVGLMWKMSGVDLQRLLEYEKEDPGMFKITDKAKANGELPYYRPCKRPEDMNGSYDFSYTGHPHLELMPTQYPGDVLFWEPSIHEWGINAAENAEDLTRAEVHIRKQIASELDFIKRKVPGFEKAHLSGVAPMLGIREGRHPVGEYILKYDDVRNGRKFDDAIASFESLQNLDMRKPELGKVKFDVPYRCLLAKKINNLLLAGDCISADHGGFIFYRGFIRSMIIGEAAGTAAALSVKNKVTPKEIKWERAL